MDMDEASKICPNCFTVMKHYHEEFGAIWKCPDPHCEFEGGVSLTRHICDGVDSNGTSNEMPEVSEVVSDKGKESTDTTTHNGA